MWGKRKIFINTDFLRYTVALFVENRRRIKLLSIVVCGATFFNIISKEAIFFRELNAKFTIADGYVLMANMFIKNVYYIPIFLMVLSSFYESSLETQIALRCRSKKNIYRFECCKIVLLSLYTAMIGALAVLLTGIFQKQEFINWSDQKSLYWIETGTTLEGHVSLIDIIICFMITTTLTLVLVGMGYFFIKTITKEKVLAYIACMCWSIIEYFSGDFMLNRLCMPYAYWLHMNYNWIIFSGIGFGCFYMLDLFVLKGREYY